MRRSDSTTRHATPGGFTLLEIMLTLVVMVTIAALAFPLLRGSLLRHRLLSGGNQLRAAFALARANAINSGDIQAMEFSDDQLGYRVDRWIGEVTDADGDNPAPPTGFKGTLPEGVSVSAVRPIGDLVQSSSAAPANGATSSSNGGANGSAAAIPDSMILFYPDGTCTSCEVGLVDQQERSLSVVLHGSTGSAVLGGIDEGNTGLAANSVQSRSAPK